jgi:hypothetical protein|uniref:Head to tail adaptor n=1 Tax=Caudovirales sp. ctCiv1 TaxID=2826769 RepID=A0A8S5M8X2_9CAUD|nr:DUF6148 family protein [uncultured Lachnoclostridium sp.]DAD78535.1 MAG TPA: head to tail adaptor [Caudovirales sp. ctCiv1]
MISNSNKQRLESCKRRLDLYYVAEQKVLEGQAYTIGSRSLTRADLKEIKKEIQSLENQIASLEERGTTKRKVARIIPRDF